MLCAQAAAHPGVESWHGTTHVHPVGLLALLVLGGAILLLPRRWAALPILVLVCLIPSGQRFILLTADFSFVRLMVIAGWLRVFLRREHAGFRPRTLDWLVASTAVTALVTYSLRWGTSPALVYQLGQSYDAFGLYFLFRCLVRDWGDLDRLALGLTATAILVAGFFVIENRTGKNLFAVFGGVPFETAIRQGKLRCQGAFPHPILAGVFWAALLPLIASRWWTDRRRVLAVLGVCAGLLTVFLSASTTPMVVVLCVALAAAFFPLRRSLSLVRWSVVAVLAALHLVMNKPVWHLVSRVDLVGGSTGWHRYHLIDQAIRRVEEWWLLGTTSTEHWGLGLRDVTNQYVLVAVRSGLLGLALFLLTIAVAFRNVGLAWRREPGRRAHVALAWALGCSLFAQCLGFVAVAYFGQVIAVWYLVLAATASLEWHSLRRVAGRRRSFGPRERPISSLFPARTAVPEPPG